MLIVSREDYLEVKQTSLIADYDRGILSSLYQPITGYAAIALYLTLWSEAENEHSNTMITHEVLFDRMKMNAGIFVESRKKLESIGLLRSFINKVGDTSIYRYELLSPKTPKDFFDDVLLHGLLIKSVGENEVSRLKRMFNLTPYDNKGEEISASFKEVYRPDLNDPVFNKALEGSKNTIGKTFGTIDGGFNYEVFFEEISKISQISSDSITSEEMKEVERLSVLYGVDETKAASMVANVFKPGAPKGKHIDFDLLTKQFQEETNYLYVSQRKSSYRKPNTISGKSDLASKINQMEVISPKDYLSVLQGGTKPAPSDLTIINILSRDYQLPNPVINAIIDFVLTKNDNILSRSYTEKIAASLKRENVETTIDAMNYLKRVTKSKKYHNIVTVTTETQTTTDEGIVKTIPQEKVEDELDWDKLLLDLEKAGK